MNAEGLWYIEDPEKPEEKTWLGAPIYFQAMTRNGDSEAWGLLIGWHDPDGKLHWWAMPYAMLNDTRQSWRAELASGGWRGATGQRGKGPAWAVIGFRGGA
jgi:putative DNA primase/helicase